MNKSILLAAALVAAPFAVTPAFASTVIDFDNLAGGSASGAYHEDGFVLSANFCNSISGACISAVNPASSIDATGTSVVKSSGAAVTFTLAREDGGAFQFGSMDFGKLTSVGNTYSSTYQFKFTLADAAQTVVTEYFTFIHGNPNPIATHTATFGDLGNITQFTFRNQSTAGQFDNIVLNDAAVPEPATWAMMIAGFGLVGGAMRRRGRAVLKLA